MFGENMSNLLTIIVIAVVLVGFFALAMSLTLIFKGHNIKSEIDQNEHMRARGITCTVREAYQTDSAVHPDGCDSLCGDDCGSCHGDSGYDQNVSK